MSAVVSGDQCHCYYSCARDPVVTVLLSATEMVV